MLDERALIESFINIQDNKTVLNVLNKYINKREIFIKIITKPIYSYVGDKRERPIGYRTFCRTQNYNVCEAAAMEYVKN